MVLLARLRAWWRGYSARRDLTLAALSLGNARDGVTYRRAESSDIRTLLDIERAVYAGALPWTYGHFDQEIAHNREAVFLVAIATAAPVAFVGLRIDFRPFDKKMHLTNIAVSPEFQRRGVGSQLMAHAIRLAASFDCRAILLEVRRDNLPAQRFYRRFGFESAKLAPAYYDDGMDAILMTRGCRDDD